MNYTRSLSLLTKHDLPFAGGKGANLGEMMAAGFPVPPGFVLTTNAYASFVRSYGLHEQIVDLASTVTSSDPQSGADASERIKRLFSEAEIGNEISEELIAAYAVLGAPAVAVRSAGRGVG